MEIKRFYAKKSQKAGNIFTIDGEEARHMIKVLRYKVGYKIIVFDGTGYDYYCTLIEIGRDYVQAQIDEKVENDADLKVGIRLFQGIAKSDKMDVIVQKAVELVVSEITPVITARSEKEVKLEKLEKVAISAAKQCGASRLTKINEPIYLSEIPFDNLVIFAHENEKNRTLRDISTSKFSKIDLVVGAEGGFSEDEGRELVEKGAVAVSLGKRILRAETAAITLICLTLYKAGVI
ncbi:MAG: 16S rRNA (uracil(1498)-N(3))-methyltransferase [Clostridia bacterium]|nr:16S rRNA (uracil(1498)-N(3))-methyltransferase [Clostridia bacterium]